MDGTQGKIGIISIIMVMMLFNGLTSHVIVNPMVLDTSGRDAWISVLMTAVLYLPWCALLVYIMRKSGQQELRTWLAKQTSPLIAWFIIAPICVELFLIGGMTVIQTEVWTVTNYLPATPQYILIITLVLVCYYSAYNGIRTITIVAGILLPTVVCLGYFVSIANMPEKDYALLKPFLEHGWQPALNGMVYTAGALVEIMLLLLFQHRFKSKMRVWQMLLLGVILVYITLGPLVGAITEFGPQEAAKQMVSPYEQWRLVKIGSYIEHVDFLSVYQWLAGATIRISLSLYLLSELIPVKTREMRRWFILSISLCTIIFSMIVTHQNSFYLWMYKIYFPATLIFTLIITIVLAVIARMAKPTKE
ncbi:endospore germination permease [Paenibacillus sp. CGMCC 1.16610]|uniref:Endospore germination permease n=1 Tax=Paenibacillus anseongense TaxID=2682845 RepID=A0ABW9UJ40_9BACL|nr:MULTISPECIES: endospore germination permease [Paenibacillus]MBA2941069.1 endospore germination permease [Paenibacillus sp. CGMCC 1.16610]MVQ39888.1 endospore germination permease [Paenibacillus anseongense]